MLDDGDHDCVERGFLLVPGALGHLIAGDPSAALDEFSEAWRSANASGTWT